MAANESAVGFNANKAVMLLVGRHAEVLVQAGRYKGQKGFVVAGKGGGAFPPSSKAEVCVELKKPHGDAKHPKVNLPLEAVRETRVGRLVHQLRHLIPGGRF